MNINLDKMNKLRIVFMGTPDFAVATLSTLHQNSYNIVGVVTTPDKPAGRGRKLSESAVKKYAIDHSLKVLQPKNLKSEDFIKELTLLKPNLIVVVAFRMLPKIVWGMPKYGTFNLHASLLPHYRGAAPINWAIINGETETGATTFFIDDKIDTGEIILQEKTHIGKEETAGSLHDRLMVLGAELVLKTVKLIEKNNVSTIQQKNILGLRSANKIHKETCKIDWNKPLNDIYNHIRGLSPYPTAWTNLINGDESTLLKIYKASMEIEEHNYKIGALIPSKKELKVATKEGYINLLELQLPGKRKMEVKDVLNGLVLSKNAYVL